MQSSSFALVLQLSSKNQMLILWCALFVDIKYVPQHFDEDNDVKNVEIIAF